MNFYLYLQSICFDRPRFMHQVYSKVKTIQDVDAYIQETVQFEQFKNSFFKRKQRYNDLCLALQSLPIFFVTIDDPLYPPQLHQLHDPPLALFYLGDIQLGLKSGLGMVGSRCPSVNAKYRIDHLLSVVNNYTLISGGALGIDALSHQAALHFKRPTIAVLACGLDALYPKTNIGLFHQMLDSGIGLIISECPPGVTPRPYYFPQRNRLIAALSEKLVVIEAAKKSGAIITANLAAQLGRDVGAIIGAFNMPQSIGCYELIQDGAYIIGNTDQWIGFLALNSNHQIQITSSISLNEDMGILDKIPYELIHIEDLAVICQLSIQEMIEKITILALNEDVMLVPGQMVRRNDTLTR